MWGWEVSGAPGKKPESGSGKKGWCQGLGGAQQLGGELVGQEYPSSRHLSPGSSTFDHIPQTLLERKARREASSVPIRYTRT